MNQRISEKLSEYRKAWRELKNFYVLALDRKAKAKWYSYLFCCLLATSAESDLINININLALPAKSKFIITENKRQQNSD